MDSAIAPHLRRERVLPTRKGADFQPPYPSFSARFPTTTTTVVGYLPGQRNEAIAVAKALDLSNNVVRPVTSGDREVACSSTPTDCPDQVVVIVGADLASIA